MPASGPHVAVKICGKTTAGNLVQIAAGSRTTERHQAQHRQAVSAPAAQLQINQTCCGIGICGLSQLTRSTSPH